MCEGKELEDTVFWLILMWLNELCLSIYVSRNLRGSPHVWSCLQFIRGQERKGVIGSQWCNCSTGGADDRRSTALLSELRLEQLLTWNLHSCSYREQELTEGPGLSQCDGLSRQAGINGRHRRSKQNIKRWCIKYAGEGDIKLLSECSGWARELQMTKNIPQRRHKQNDQLWRFLWAFCRGVVFYITVYAYGENVVCQML